MIPQVIFLICADAEWQATLRLLPGSHLQPTPYGEWFAACLQPELPVRPINHGEELPPQGILAGFMHTGWGKIAAAGATQYAVDTWKPDLLVNLGTCGGIEGLVKRGEILLVEQTVVYDILEQMGDQDEHLAHYSCQLDYSWLSKAYPQEARRTLLVSGDRDLLPSDIPWLKEHFGAIAGDWETGAIAYVAQRNGSKLLILRGVTDLVSSAGGEAYGNLDLFQQATQQIIQQLLVSIYSWVAPALN